MFKLQKEKLDLENELGKGAFGKIYPYQDLKWAVKRLEIKNVEELCKCIPEMMIGFACDHPCVLPVKGFHVENGNNKHYINLKLPRMKQSLMEEFREKRAFQEDYKEEKILLYFYALACGLDYLHRKKVFHGDIKLDNILIDFTGKAVLSDVGCSRYIPEDDSSSYATHTFGAQDYKAPEVIKHEIEQNNHLYQTEEEKRKNPPKGSLKKGDLFLADSWSF